MMMEKFLSPAASQPRCNDGGAYETSARERRNLPERRAWGSVFLVGPLAPAGLAMLAPIRRASSREIVRRGAYSGCCAGPTKLVVRLGERARAELLELLQFLEFFACFVT